MFFVWKHQFKIKPVEMYCQFLICVPYKACWWDPDKIQEQSQIFKPSVSYENLENKFLNMK